MSAGIGLVGDDIVVPWEADSFPYKTPTNF